MEEYSLRIFCKDIDQYLRVTRILESQPTNRKLCPYWILKIELEEEYVDLIGFFLDLLEGKYEALEKIGISREKITIWYLYEYDQECNMEFDPEHLKKLGENGIKLCISCWTNN